MYLLVFTVAVLVIKHKLTVCAIELSQQKVKLVFPFSTLTYMMKHEYLFGLKSPGNDLVPT